MAELVGILNLTPNSSTEEDNFFTPYYGAENQRRAIAYGEKLFEDGAVIVDIGAESTSPGVQPVDPRTERWRLEPVLPALIKAHPGQIALDTRHPETAEWALEEFGDVIINDVTGMNNLKMANLVAKHGARCIVSHMVGIDIQAVHDPKTPKISDVEVVYSDLRAKHALLISMGLDPDKITLDPGIGFGKTPDANLSLIRAGSVLSEFRVMIGISRKRVVGEKCFTISKDEDRKDLEPNLRAARVALLYCSNIALRVHDVAGHQELISQYS